MSLLYLPYTDEGLKSPNVLWYSWAVQLRTIRFYFATENVPQWKEMETEGLNLPLFMYLHSDKLSNLVRQTSNPIVKKMVKVWFDAKKSVEEPNVLSQHSPIRGNQYFTTGRADTVCKSWASKGLQKIQDLYLFDSNNMMSFEELRCKFEIEKKENTSLNSFNLETSSGRGKMAKQLNHLKLTWKN